MVFGVRLLLLVDDARLVKNMVKSVDVFTTAVVVEPQHSHGQTV